MLTKDKIREYFVDRIEEMLRELYKKPPYFRRWAEKIYDHVFP